MGQQMVATYAAEVEPLGRAVWRDVIAWVQQHQLLLGPLRQTFQLIQQQQT